ncbi:hypothetical protein NQ015_04800 [Corynebacterium sp. 153RC1]|uniref:AMIN-like domain-containing (lipo)protein n=1 Tax=unclassified Corynebacterium TaxID=2624378 RepID=UPI00211C5E13|nr:MULTISPECIES: hypothetical protein [unclassified Corynebacterium]MCQ9369966.1 hypothetical protein [Corynebacterium sp. 35RC1]MCQ9352191.1 hypothetical protein [Corynebacterium sp. 209RC1]MCQ9354194.1 hypothetical protein [Corynebacterium sp. 1222RC1]MCQ9356474.1 hypothetical protein [Corynebacterium sp. 122RC1]MCQ9358576.1 hypothetical protein [Corynebacterium sp. 142RC1]
MSYRLVSAPFLAPVLAPILAIGLAACSAPEPSLATLSATSTATTSTTTATTTTTTPVGDLDPKESAGTAAELQVQDVRVGTHDGYDRIVFEFSGTGTPGWFINYTTEPAQQGSGFPVEFEGGTALDIHLRGILMPFETGVDVGPLRSDGAGAINAVESHGIFEGQEQFVAGIDKPRPYSVTLLENPTRLVIDIQQ